MMPPLRRAPRGPPWGSALYACSGMSSCRIDLITFGARSISKSAAASASHCTLVVDCFKEECNSFQVCFLVTVRKCACHFSAHMLLGMWRCASPEYTSMHFCSTVSHLTQQQPLLFQSPVMQDHPQQDDIRTGEWVHEEVEAANLQL